MTIKLEELMPRHKPIQTLDGKTSTFSRYSLNELKWYFHNYVKKYHEGYEVDDENKEVITALLLYFSQNPAFESLPQIKAPSLKKGILLAGNVGSGKSLLLRILKDMGLPSPSFQVKSCREVANAFLSDGFNGIRVYGSDSVQIRFEKHVKRHVLFDDLGAESSVVHYGNKLNVIQEILLERYNHFVRFGLMTHLTTNLNRAELEQTYGHRVMSRMHEMFNFLTLGGKKQSKDRRI